MIQLYLGNNYSIDPNSTLGMGEFRVESILSRHVLLAQDLSIKRKAKQPEQKQKSNSEVYFLNASSANGNENRSEWS